MFVSWLELCVKNRNKGLICQYELMFIQSMDWSGRSGLLQIYGPTTANSHTHTFMDLFIIYFKYSCLEPFSVVSPFDRIFQYYSKLFQSFRVMKPHSSCFNHTMRLKNEKDKFQSPDVLLPFSALLNNRDHHHIKRSF